MRLKLLRLGTPSPPAPRRRAPRTESPTQSHRETFAGSSFDDLIRPQQQRRRDRQTERLGGLEVNHELELRGLLDGEVARLRALEDLVDEGGGAPKTVEQVGPEGHEAAAVDVAAQGVDRWKSIVRGKRG